MFCWMNAVFHRALEAVLPAKVGRLPGLPLCFIVIWISRQAILWTHLCPEVPEEKALSLFSPILFSPHPFSFPRVQAWSVVWVTGQCWAGRLSTFSRIIIPAFISVFSLPWSLFSSHADQSWGLGSVVDSLNDRSQLWPCWQLKDLGQIIYLLQASVSSSVIYR